MLLSHVNYTDEVNEHNSLFNKLTFIISKYSTDGKNFAAELEIPRVIFYEDIRSFYSDKISIWEGK